MVSESRAGMLAVGMVACLCVLLSVSDRIYDPDTWQHLLVGKAIWQLHAIPTTHLWTWPSYGEPDILPSWLFRALIWPFWSVGGVTGLFVWRWSTTLAAFGLLWATARRMGARGFSTYVVLVLCSFLYRERSMVRPETLVAVLLALELWILETRRHGGKDHAVWLIPISWLWTNAHVSFPLGFFLIGVYGIDAWLSSRTWMARNPGRWHRPGGPGRLGAALVGAFAVSLLHPFGWPALRQPFEFVLRSRNELIYRNIVELRPLFWKVNLRNDLPQLLQGWPVLLLLLGWPVLLLARARRRGLDLVELLCCAVFTALGLSAQRFLGFYALVAAPFVARDLSLWMAGRRVGARVSTMAQAAAAAVACAGISLPGWTQRVEIGFDMGLYPVAACEFMAAHGVRGRSFNPFHWGGYLLYRFWPERDRLPFMDIHVSGTREDRSLYIRALVDSSAWQALDRKHRFDWVLLDCRRPRGYLLDVLDADSSWALVFVDDPSALYVRRRGPLALVARRFGYLKLPGGSARLEALRQECKRDTAACAIVAAELERAAAASPLNSQAHSMLANLALYQGRYGDARDHLLRSLAVDPHTPWAHWRLGLAALEENRPGEAVQEFLLQRRTEGDVKGLMVRLGAAYQRVGDLRRARASFRRALALDPSDAEARDSLAALEGRPAH